MHDPNDFGLDHKFARLPARAQMVDDTQIEGYASYFNHIDQGRDVVMPGAFAASLARLKAAGRSVKMLWQHDPTQPIGVWDEVREDEIGLFVKGHLIADVPKSLEAARLLSAGALDGLSIGYRTIKAQKRADGSRALSELDLWEVSLVTFPMLPEARVAAKAQAQSQDCLIREFASAVGVARSQLAGCRSSRNLHQRMPL